MRLDKSRVPPEKMDDLRLKEEEEKVIQDMRDQQYRLYVCLHEAAHGIYMERAGAKRLIYHGPIAFYDAESDTFTIASAGIRSDFGSSPVDVNSLAVARWYAAGVVAQCSLTGYSLDEKAEQQDFKDFVKEFRSFNPSDDQPNLIFEHWEQAKRDVEKDLRSPALRQELWRRARHFEAWLLA